MANITYQDLLTNNKGNLFSQYGMNPKGDNEGGAWARRTMQPVGAGLANQALFASNELEPARQSAYRYLMALSQPGNQEGVTNRLQNEAKTAYGNAGAQASQGAAMHGLSPEFAQALEAGFRLAGTGAANDALLGEQDRKANAMSMLAQMASQGQQSPLLQLFQSLFQDIEGRSQANKADRANGGLGGILGSLGSIASMIPGGQWASLLGGKKGAGQDTGWMG